MKKKKIVAPAPREAARPAMRPKKTTAPAYRPEPCLIPRAEMRRIVLEMIG